MEKTRDGGLRRAGGRAEERKGPRNREQRSSCPTLPVSPGLGLASVSSHKQRCFQEVMSHPKSRITRGSVRPLGRTTCNLKLSDRAYLIISIPQLGSIQNLFCRTSPGKQSGAIQVTRYRYRVYRQTAALLGKWKLEAGKYSEPPEGGRA